MKKEQWVYREGKYGDTYFNGSVTWNWDNTINCKNTPSQINALYIFNSEQEAIESNIHEEFPTLKELFTLVEVSTKFIKPEGVYPPYFPNNITLLRGRKNEYCSVCGQNIIADEPYMRWYNKKLVCLHCIIENSRNIKDSYKDVPDRNKSEWAMHGKKGYNKKCTGFS